MSIDGNDKASYFRLWSWILASVLSIASFPTSARENIPHFWQGAMEKHVTSSINHYIGHKATAEFFYKGLLVDQIFSGFDITRKTVAIHKNIYLLSGWRNQDADNQSAVVVTRSGHVLLAAVGTMLVRSNRITPVIAVFVRDRKNLFYLSAIREWIPHRYHGYLLRLYNLNCANHNKKWLITNCPLHGMR